MNLKEYEQEKINVFQSQLHPGEKKTDLYLFIYISVFLLFHSPVRDWKEKHFYLITSVGVK